MPLAVRFSRSWVSALCSLFRSLPRVLGLAGCGFLTCCGATERRSVAAAETIMDEVGVAGFGENRMIARPSQLDERYAKTAFARTIRAAVLQFPALEGQEALRRSEAARQGALVGSLGPQLGARVSAGQGLLEDGEDLSTGASLTVRQLLYDGATTQNRLSQTHITQRQLDAEIESLLGTLTRQMATVWLDVWLQGELLNLSIRDLAAYERFLQETQLRLGAGAVTRSDVFLVQTRLADTRTLIAETRAGLARAQASLRALLGELPDRVELPPNPPLLAAATAQERAFSGSQMAALQLAVASAESAREIAVSRRVPGVFLELNVVRTDILSDNADNDVLLGVSVDHDIFTGGQQAARESEAINSLTAARSALEEGRRQILQALDVALASRESATLEMATAREAISIHEVSLSATEAQFAAGRRGVGDLLNAQRDLSSARARLLRVEARRVGAEFMLLELTGDLTGLFGLARIDSLDRVSQ